MIRNSDLVADLMERHGMAESDATNFVETAFALIQDGLQLGEIVKVKGLGTFKIMQTKERESVDVNTGERILLGSRPKVIFTPDIVLRERVNAPFAGFASVPLSEGVDVDIESNSDNAISNTTEESAQTNTIVDQNDTTEATSSPSETEIENVSSEKEVLTADTEDNNDHSLDIASVEDEPAADDSLQCDEAEKKTSRLRLLVVLLSILLFLSIGFSAYLLWKIERVAQTPLPIAKTETTATEANKDSHRAAPATLDTTKVATSANKKAQADSTSSQSLPQAEPKQKSQKSEPDSHTAQSHDDYPSMSHPFQSNDPRVKHGAYYIIGTTTTVTVEKGQTFEGICRAYLGEGMDCYVEVYNDKNTVKAGDKLKIPKLITKKAWKNKKK